jgi:hypothetical protein
MSTIVCGAGFPDGADGSGASGRGRLVFALAGALCASLFAPGAASADPHHPTGKELLSTTCRDYLQNELSTFDKRIPWAYTAVTVALNAKTQSATNPCSGYSWIAMPGTYGLLTIKAGYYGVDINRYSDAQNAWDCNHSSVEYAVYNWTNGAYQVVSYANLYGNYVNGTCVHDGSGIASEGSPTTSLYTTSGTVVAIKSWQHNDPAYGHGGYGTTPNLYWPSTLSVDRTFYDYCSAENQTCNFSGTREVRYGANGSYKYKVTSDGVACSTAVFGDPAPGSVKSCYKGLRGFTYCASEGGSCSFSGTKTVAYGAGGKFAFTQRSNNFTCSIAEFGVDPNSGVLKLCYIQN